MNVRKYTPIILLNFVNIVGFTILIPVLPQISSAHSPENLSAIIYGLLISTYALCQFIAAPLLGSLSDKYGRRPLLFISQLGTTLSWLIFGSSYFIPSQSEFFGLSSVLIVILISRITDGLTGGNISVASAWISDITPKENKAEIFGLMGAVFGIGLLVGPTIGGLSYNLFGFGYLSTAFIAFLLSLYTLFQIWKLLPESLPGDRRDRLIEIKLFDELNIWKQYRNFKESKLISNLLILRLFFAFVFASYTTLITLLLINNFGLSSRDVGLLISFIGIFSILNQGLLVRKFVNKFGDLHTVFISIAITLTGLFFITFINPIVNQLPLVTNIALFMLDAYLINLGISLAMPAFKSVLTNNVSDTKQGRITGLDESILSLGNGLSPIIAGILFTFINSYSFLTFFIILLIPFLILRSPIMRAHYNEKKTPV